MAHLNRAQIIGYLGQEPELKYTQSQEAVLKIRVGVSERWKAKDGTDRERTTWFSCVLWGKRGPSLEKMLRKGSQVYVEGPIRTREWDDKEGVRHWAWDLAVEEIQLLDRAPKEQDPVRERETSFGDDDIPF